MASYAMKNAESAGRVYKEPEDPYRLPFQRDRARIIHSKSFRRLQAKTQVFVSYFGDHYRDRMTHSIEVSQIARDISRTLGLNEDLSECLALAHDLGHPPFGHGGEAALDEVLQPFGLHFEHNEQSRRIIEKLEKIHPEYDGLNVTKEVLDGLLKHHPELYKKYLEFETSPHLEAQVVDLSDEIAYTNHDIDDGLRSGLITIEQLQQFTLWQNAEKMVSNEIGTGISLEDNDKKDRFYLRVISTLIKLMIHDLYSTTHENLERNQIKTVHDVRAHKGMLVGFSTEMKQQLADLRAFLMKNYYLNPKVSDVIDKGKQILKDLFRHYLDHPEKLPHPSDENVKASERLEVVIKDYLAGMTDHYAEEMHSKITNS